MDDMDDMDGTADEMARKTNARAQEQRDKPPLEGDTRRKRQMIRSCPPCTKKLENRKYAQYAAHEQHRHGRMRLL